MFKITTNTIHSAHLRFDRDPGPDDTFHYVSEGSALDVLFEASGIDVDDPYSNRTPPDSYYILNSGTTLCVDSESDDKEYLQGLCEKILAAATADGWTFES